MITGSWETLSYLVEIAEEAAELHILPSFRSLDASSVRGKQSASDLVTAADLASEKLITQRLTEAFPGAVVVGEEAVYVNPKLSDQIADAEMCFVVDPIDGTLNFARGVPVFGVMISLVEGGVSTLGLITDPITGDWIGAVRGQGAREYSRKENSEKILSGLQSRRNSEKFGLLPIPLFREDIQDRLFQASKSFFQTTWLGCSAYEMRLLANAKFDFALEPFLKPWDMIAGQLIHEEVGGYSALISGEAYEPAMTDGSLLLASSKDEWLSVQSAFESIDRDEWPGRHSYPWPSTDPNVTLAS